MEVYAFDPFIPAEAIEKDGVRPVTSAEELYEKCQYVSLHIPANEHTIKSINYDLLSKMPAGATLVNEHHVPVAENRREHGGRVHEEVQRGRAGAAVDDRQRVGLGGAAQ